MDNLNNTKKYPATTDEVAKLLGLKASDHSLPMSSISTGDLPVANLPVVESANHGDAHVEELKKTANHDKQDTHGSEKEVKKHIDQPHAPVLVTNQNAPKIIKAAKTVLPYVGIFSVGLFLYYFFFTGVDFNSLFKGIELKTQNVSVTPKETALDQLKNQGLDGYNKWIAGFYYNVSDTKITDPDADNSGNGLSNFQKYLLNLNPKSYDTLGLGMSDTEAIAQGINPLSGAPLTDKQKEIINKYFDMEVAMNRLTLAKLQNPGEVAGASTQDEIGLRGLPAVKRTPTFNPPKTGIENLMVSDDKSVNINSNIVGHLDIPSLNVAVPIVWSADPKNFDKDLQTGVVHYPGTAIPGQVGTTYIAGHSSNYIWAKGNYNSIFSKLGDLKDNASFSVSVTDVNGKLVTYHYVVVSRQEYSPTDPAQIKNTGKSLVALSTCWPLNSTAKRLVVYGQLTQVEK